MISIARIRELLAEDATGLSDLEIDAFRQDAYARMGHLVTAFEDRQRSTRMPQTRRMTNPKTTRSMRLVSR